MPAQYEGIRDEIIRHGIKPRGAKRGAKKRKVGIKTAKTIAAKIYNARHPGNPVTRSSD